MIYLYSKDLVFKGIIQEYESLSASIDYLGIGKFTLVISSIDVAIAREIKHDDIIWEKGKTHAYYVTTIEYDNTLTIRGYTTMQLLDKRISWGTYNINNVESGVYNIINDNLRGLPNILTAPIAGITVNRVSQYSFRSLLDNVLDAVDSAGLNCVMLFDTTQMKHVFKVFQSVNKSRSGTGESVYSDEFGTLPNLQILDDYSEFKNYVIVAGEGEGLSRVITSVGTATGGDRYELFVDARDLQKEHLTQAEYLETLRARGVDKLREYVKSTAFKFSLTITEGSLGDLVTCISKKLDLEFTVKITNITVRYEKDRPPFLTFTVGNDEIIKLGGIKI